MLTLNTIQTITDTLQSALENATDLLGFAEEDGRTEDAAILREAVDQYQSALDEFTDPNSD